VLVLEKFFVAAPRAALHFLVDLQSPATTLDA